MKIRERLVNPGINPEEGKLPLYASPKPAEEKEVQAADDTQADAEGNAESAPEEPQTAESEEGAATQPAEGGAAAAPIVGTSGNSATPIVGISETTTATNGQPTSGVTVVGPEGKAREEGFLERYLRENPQRVSDEDMERLRKREKRNKIFASIGDGIAALSNLWHTTQYAPNSYSGEHSMTKATQARFDKILKDMQAERANWMKGYQNAAKLDIDKNYKDGLLYYKGKADERAEKKDKREEELHPYAVGTAKANEDTAKEKAKGEVFVTQGKETDAETKKEQKREATAKANIAETKATYEPQMQQERINTEKTKQNANNASAENSRASAKKNNAQAGKASAETNQIKRQGYHHNGHTYSNTTDYEAAVYRDVDEWNKNNPGNKIPKTYITDSGSVGYYKAPDLSAAYTGKTKNNKKSGKGTMPGVKSKGSGSSKKSTTKKMPGVK